MEQLKHECGVALLRLLKPLEYYKEKYGSFTYALDRLYLLMEKQHNRGQEAAGVGVVKLNTTPGHEYVFRERAQGTRAIDTIFEHIHNDIAPFLRDCTPEQIESEAPFIGEIYMGHLRYSTTGKSGISYVHPFLRRNNWPSRNLLLCGNFNMTNVSTIFQQIVDRGQHPRLYSDTIVLLEQLGDALDKENHRQYRVFRNSLVDPELGTAIDDNIDIARVLQMTAPSWDGGYTICGATGSGHTFALRDPAGIRPAYYFANDEIVVLASERPAIQTVFNISDNVTIKELEPGSALIITKNGRVKVEKIIEPRNNSRCSFERIYFSRATDADIYNERKQLGRNIAPAVLRAVDYDFVNTVFSYVPNTAEIAFSGLTEALDQQLNTIKAARIVSKSSSGVLTTAAVEKILNQRVRVEKTINKDIKLRTFIAQGAERNHMTAHVYDITQQSIHPNTDNLVLLDDSIVRGTTLRESILRIASRLKPKRIVVVSSAPQVRYPDCYGIDMSSLGELAAFRAAIEIHKKNDNGSLIDEIYKNCKAQQLLNADERTNCVKPLYDTLSPEQIAQEMAQQLTPAECAGTHVTLIFQTMQGLHNAVPNHPGDWYFTGNYPTPGGINIVNNAFINYYEGNSDLRQT